jgi:hypothetical protein
VTIVTPAELTVIAALGASALTGAASLGVVTLQERIRSRSADRDTLAAAVTAMLSRSMAVMWRAQAMGLQMRMRSGLSEGADVALRLRKPADALELNDWMAIDMAPLNEAWSVIWARGDQETVRLANALLDKCSVLLAAATATEPAGTATARLRRWAAGEKWTPELQAALDRAVKDVAHAREHLAQYARTLLKLRSVTLFGHEPKDPVPDAGNAQADGPDRIDPVDEPVAAPGGVLGKTAES